VKVAVLVVENGEGDKSVRKNQLIILIVAISVGGGAAYLARSWLQAQMNVAAAYQPAGHIVIAADPSHMARL
jgi:hypothetical protein